MSTKNDHLSPNAQKDDYENALRPKHLNEFIGQKQLKENLKIF